MNRPLFWMGLALSLGITVADRLRLLFFWPYLCAVILFLLCVFFARKEKIFFILLFFIYLSLGALLLINSRVLPKNHLLRLKPPKGSTVYLQGVVIDDPQEKSQKISFLLKAERLKIDNRLYKASGRALVRVSGRRRVFFGDRLILQGKIFRPFYLRSSRGLNYREYLRNKKIYVIFSVGKDNLLKKTEPGHKNPFVYSTYKIRRRLKRITDENISSLSAPVMNALLLGIRGDLPAGIKDTLANTGTVHIIAISGLHLGIFAFIVLIFLKVLRLPKKPRYTITILILWAYCVLTGSNPPVIRSAIMATILLSGLAIRRQPDIFNSLLLAALVILFINPGQLFLLSFQLSFISVISLIFLAPKIRSLLSRSPNRGRRIDLLLNCFSSSLGAWLGLSPLIFYYFGIISPVAIPGNMVIVPYMGLVIACGVAFFLAGLVSPALLPVFSTPAELSILFLLKIIALLERIPFSHFRLK